jgi:hypothetical protein
VIFDHYLELNTVTGDFNVNYKITNDNVVSNELLRSTHKTKKNDFKMLFDLCDNSFMRGEKRVGFWGVKYHRNQDEIIGILSERLKSKFKSNFYKEKDYNTSSVVNRFYDLVVDFHLDMKGIKSHDGIYYDIQNEYPKKKWLEKNDFKFLPAVLDSYGIKSKYLISELNKKSNKPIYLKTLNYICKMFGPNYIDYIKQFVWENHCFELPPNRKTQLLKNESEKQFMVKTIQNWETTTLKSDSLVYSLNKLFIIREMLEVKGYDLKYKAKNDNEFENHMEMWSGIKTHLNRGYKVRYSIPEEFLTEIQEDIVIGDKVYKPFVLVTEDDYRVEGFNMKNCMSKQFLHGFLYIYVSLSHKRKKINLQYRKGRLVQCFGKANTAVDSIVFGDAIEVLTKRIQKYPDLEWKKEKYDFINP